MFNVNQTSKKSIIFIFISLFLISCGGGGSSSNATVGQKQEPPGLAKNITAVAVDGVVRLTWNTPQAGSDPSYYIIDKSKDNNPKYVMVNNHFTTNNTLSLSDTDVVNGSNYVYRIVAVTDTVRGKSGYSNRVIPIAGRPESVSQVNITISQNVIQLTWQAPSTGVTPTYYTIERKSDIQPTFRNINNPRSDKIFSFLDTQVVIGLTYTYRIFSVNNEIRSAPVESEALLVPTPPLANTPGKTQNIVAIADYRTVTLTWDAPLTGDPVKYYTIERSDDNQKTFTIVDRKYTVFTGKNLFRIDSPLKTRTTYIYRFIAVNDSGASEAGYSNNITPQVTKAEIDIQLPQTILSQTSISFGSSLAVSDDGLTLAVANSSSASYGSVSIFEKNEVGDWKTIPIVEYVTSNADISNGFANTIALTSAGNTLAVSEVSNTCCLDKIFIYKRDAQGNWGINPASTLISVSNNKPNHYGAALEFSPDDSTLAVGEVFSGMPFGSIQLFTKNSNNSWNVTATTTLSISNTEEFGRFITFSPDSKTLAVSARVVSDSDGDRVFLFSKNINGAWNTTATIFRSASIITADSGFGSAINISRDTSADPLFHYSSGGKPIQFSPDGSSLAIGEQGGQVNNIIQAGKVNIYTHDSTGKWNTTVSTILTSIIPNTKNFFGGTIAFSPDSNTLAIAEISDDNSGLRKEGNVQIFNRDIMNGNWSLVPKTFLTPGDVTPDELNSFGKTIIFDPVAPKLLASASAYLDFFNTVNSSIHIFDTRLFK